MATRAEVTQAAQALNRISRAADADLAGLLAEVDPSDRRAAGRLLDAAYPAILAEYGSASAALGADLAELWAEDLRARPQLAIARPINAAQASGAAAWALNQPDWRANLTLMTDRLVKQPYRDTIQDTATRSRLAWARVPTGATTCAFCMLVASRGAVYGSARSAGNDRKYHGDCDCQVVMVRDEADYPEGYDPQAYYDVYSAGWSVAKDNGSTATKNVLAGMRKAADLS